MLKLFKNEMKDNKYLPKMVEEKLIELKKLRNENVNIGEDLCYHKAIFDGSWPSSVEILKRVLEKAKKRREEEKYKKIIEFKKEMGIDDEEGLIEYLSNELKKELNKGKEK